MELGFRRILTWLACALLILGLSLPMFAQAAPEGRIAGIVKDASGAVVPGAAVVVTNDNTNATFNTTTTAEGIFVVPSLSAGSYTVKITAKGFASASYKQVMVEVGKEYSLTAILKVGQTTEVVDVVAGQELVNTTSSDVTATITTNQVNNLPLNGRDIISMISTQAGVTYNGRGATVINGGRPSWSQVTLDGVNIQDIFIRTNALDYIPNRPTTDTVQEFSINGSGQGADAALGSTGVRMITPSGANDYHGGVWWYNRQNALAANSYYNDQFGLEKPFYLNNEFGGKMGGHIIKNKLFFFGYYEGIRERRSATGTRNIPMNDDFKTGVFRYPGGPAAGVNIITLMNTALANHKDANGNPAPLPPLTIDPLVKSAVLDQLEPASALGANPVPGDSYNYAGIPFAQLDNYPRDNYGGKVDFNPTERHHFDFTYSYLHEMFWRGDTDYYNPTPVVTNDSKVKLYTAAWRFNVTNSLINNVRFGMNNAPAPFIVSAAAQQAQKNQGFFFGNLNSYTGSGALGITDPMMTFMEQGRYPKIYQVLDDATYVKGNHYLSFGGQYQHQVLPPYNAAGIIPTITMGLPTASATAPAEMKAGLSGLFTAAGYAEPDSTFLPYANTMLAFLTGVYRSESQRFNVTDPTSGYVPGAEQVRHLGIDDLSFYGQDKWRLTPSLTVTAGLKWEYISPYREQKGLNLGPVFTDPNHPQGTMLDPNAQVGFLKDVYNKQYKNIGPNIGFAWDPFKNGKTSIRGGYSLAFVNDEIETFAYNAASTGNAGLSTTVNLSGLYSTLSGTAPGGTQSGIIPVTAPAFVMPRTLAQQLQTSTGAQLYGINPNLATPMVHEFNFGIERELPKDIGLSVRYVGTLGRDLLRAMDLNQNKAASNAAFVRDFQIARSNGYLSSAAGLGWTPVYNPNVAGSQPLTYLTTATLGGDPWADLASMRTFLQQNALADMADYYAYYRTTYTKAPALFLPNPSIYEVYYGYNGSYSSYHGMSAEVRRRFKTGLQFQANYTWSKLLTNSAAGGTSQGKLDPFLDNARPFLNKSRANFDLRHALKGNLVYELPFGKGKQVLNNPNRILDKFVSGWQLSTISYWQSGNPFSIYDCRGTFIRGSGGPVAAAAGTCGNSGLQGPISILPASEIRKLFGFWVDPNSGKQYYINPNYINVKNPSCSTCATTPWIGTNSAGTGRPIAPDSQYQTAGATFTQIFFHPGPGQLGNLRPYDFDGPANWNVDLGLAKNFKVTERVNTLFRIDAFNVLNHPVFYIPDQSVNSANFGQIRSGTNNTERRIQLSLRINF